MSNGNEPMEENALAEVVFDPEKIPVFLDERGLTQKDLNTIAGYKNHNVVNKIVHKSRKADASDLIKFCLALNKDVRDFAK